MDAGNPDHSTLLENRMVKMSTWELLRSRGTDVETSRMAAVIGKIRPY